jgi:hypothetical protein
LDGWTSELATKAQIWNWGSQGLDSIINPKAVAKQLTESRPKRWNLPILQSLIDDLHDALYEKRFRDSEQRSPLFRSLSDVADGFVNHIILELHANAFFESGRPIAHIFADLIACILFLKELAGRSDDSSSQADQLQEIQALRERFWRNKFGTHHWKYREY